MTTDQSKCPAGGGDTPETDAFSKESAYVDLVEFARKLERQRDEAISALKARSRQIGVACEKHDLIHALECGYCFKEMRERAESSEAKIADLERENKELRALVYRYRHETILGHQPHMIAHLADAILEKK